MQHPPPNQPPSRKIHVQSSKKGSGDHQRSASEQREKTLLCPGGFVGSCVDDDMQSRGRQASSVRFGFKKHQPLIDAFVQQSNDLVSGSSYSWLSAWSTSRSFDRRSDLVARRHLTEWSAVYMRHREKS